MTDPLDARSALLLLPFGALFYAASLLLRCHHKNELLCMRAEGMGLRCVVCGRTRPHPWGAEPARYHRTQERGNYPEIPNSSRTGIEREAEREAAERQQVDAAIADMERQDQHERIAADVRARFRRVK